MPSHKREASSPLEPRRQSRRIASQPRKTDLALDDPTDSDRETDESQSHATDDDDDDDDDESAGDDDKGESDTGGEQEAGKDSDDEDNERRVTIIPHEQLRPLDGIDYADHKLHKNTLLFLKDLKANNLRAWFKSHHKEFKRAAKDWESFVETLMPKITDFDETIPELPPKDVIFRIYRDVRFSKNPTPYKPHFSAAFSRTGKKPPYACYYIHLDPGSSFVGGGVWAPEASTIRLLRESIDEDPAAWREVLGSEPFRKTFLPKAKDSEEGAVKAFADVNREGALKTSPRDYDASHRDIQLLKLRRFHAAKKVDDAIFTAEDGQEKLIEIMRVLEPFVTFLNSIIMPD